MFSKHKHFVIICDLHYSLISYVNVLQNITNTSCLYFLNPDERFVLKDQYYKNRTFLNP